MAKRQEKPVTEQLREAILASGKSLNQLAKESGVGPDRLSRFMRHERGLSSEAIDQICAALGLELAKKG